jgi:predicted nucleic acid-binding protein
MSVDGGRSLGGSGRAFVDTNVLVYAHDRGAGERHAVARDVVAGLWQVRSGVLSTQVLQELYVNVRRKAKRPLGLAAARRIVEDYLCWHVVVNDGESILEALELETRYRISFWDALVVQAANAAAVEILYSEDLAHGQTYGAVRVVNPFAA